jgi:hypothetical protein
MSYLGLILRSGPRLEVDGSKVWVFTDNTSCLKVMDLGLIGRCGEKNGEVLGRCSVEQLSEFKVQGSGTATWNNVCKILYIFLNFGLCISLR